MKEGDIKNNLLTCNDSNFNYVADLGDSDELWFKKARLFSLHCMGVRRWFGDEKQVHKMVLRALKMGRSELLTDIINYCHDGEISLKHLLPLYFDAQAKGEAPMLHQELIDVIGGEAMKDIKNFIYDNKRAALIATFFSSCRKQHRLHRFLNNFPFPYKVVKYILPCLLHLFPPKEALGRIQLPLQYDLDDFSAFVKYCNEHNLPLRDRLYFEGDKSLYDLMTEKTAASVKKALEECLKISNCYIYNDILKYAIEKIKLTREELQGLVPEERWKAFEKFFPDHTGKN